MIYILLKFSSFNFPTAVAPVCEVPASSTYGVGRSESTKLSCNVEATPDVILFRWVLNNSLGTVVLRDWNDESFESVLEYMPEDDTDYGALLCWGQNSVGTQKEPCIFNIVPAGKLPLNEYLRSVIALLQAIIFF